MSKAGREVGVRLGSRPIASHRICVTLKRENITLLVVPSLLAPRRWGRFAEETSALQRQKCYTDDVNQFLHN